MSSRGILSNKLYVTIDILFEKAWNDLSSDDQKQIVSENISLLDADDLIAELENRGFECVKEE